MTAMTPAVYTNDIFCRLLGGPAVNAFKMTTVLSTIKYIFIFFKQ